MNPAIFNQMPIDPNMASLFLMNKQHTQLGGLPRGMPGVPAPFLTPRYIARHPFLGDPG